MSGIESTRVSTSITTYEKIQTVQTTVQKETVQNNEPVTSYNNDGYAKLDPNNKAGNASTNINILPEEKPVEKTPDSSIRATKKIATGVLVGGGAGAVAGMIGIGVVEETFKISPKAIGMGAAIGTGIALLNTETNDKNLKVSKNVAGAALLGGGSAAVATSLAKSIMKETAESAGHSSVLLGAGLGAGIALNKANVGEGKTANLVKNTAAGALIAGSATGLATGLAKSIFASQPNSASPTIIALGASVGAGIKLANADVDNKGLRVAKNALAGTMIGGGVAGIATSFGKTLATEAFSTPSLRIMGVAAAIGAGIAIYNTKE